MFLAALQDGKASSVFLNNNFHTIFFFTKEKKLKSSIMKKREYLTFYQIQNSIKYLKMNLKK